MQEPAFPSLICTESIPLFAAAALDELYGSLYSTLTHLGLHDGLQATSTYAAWNKNKLSALFLFRQAAGEVTVMNQGMQLDPCELERFGTTIFARYPKVGRIHFHAVRLSSSPAKQMALRFACTEDMVISLPTTEQDYLARLGKSTRKSLRQHLTRAQAVLPAFRYIVKNGHAVPRQVIEHIIGFNHQRMANKKRASALKGETSRKLTALIRDRGEVGMIYAGVRLCAGTLACRVGEDIFSLVNAHDPAYDDLSLGSVCRFLMIKNSIHTGARRFHLLGGQIGNKQEVLGERLPLDHLVLYRSRRDLLRDAAGIARLACESALYRAQSWVEIQTIRPDQSLFSRLLIRLVALRRRLRHPVDTAIVMSNPDMSE